MILLLIFRVTDTAPLLFTNLEMTCLLGRNNQAQCKATPNASEWRKTRARTRWKPDELMLRSSTASHSPVSSSRISSACFKAWGIYEGRDAWDLLVLKTLGIESFKNRIKYHSIRWNLVLVVEHPPLPAILWCEQQRTSRSWQFLLSDLPHLCWQPAIEVVTCPLLRYPQEKRNRRWRTDMPVSQVGSQSLCLWLVTRQESKLKPHLVVVQGQCSI